MADTNSPAPQTENVAGGVTSPVQGPIHSTGATGNTSGNDAIGLPMDPDVIDAAMFHGAPLPVTGPVAQISAPVQTVPAPVIPAAPVVTQAGEPTPPVTTAAPVVATPELTTPPVATPGPETTGPGAGERILPARIGTGQFSPTTQRAMALMHELNNGKPEGEGAVTLADCLAMVASADGGQPINVTPVGAVAPEPAQPSPAETLRGEVQALETQLRSAGEDQVLFGPELANALIELSDKKALLATLTAAETHSKQTQIQNHVAAREAVKQQVVAEYRGADDSTTVLGSRVASLIGEMQDPKHPDHARLDLPDAPRFVVEKAADSVASQIAEIAGISKDQALATLRTAPATAPAVQPTQPLPVAGNRAVTVASGSAGTGGTGSPPSEAQILAAAAADIDSIDGLLGYRTGFRIGG